jgi:alkanesulfonate monooxygenase SsuD/methylene tetrahydromethanopterin reductase-like flavin-dependent oxidoreductase (luciferase family)
MVEATAAGQNRIAEAIGERLGRPGIVLWAPAGMRRESIELGRRIEADGWSLIGCPTASADDNLGLAQATLASTEEVAVSTSIANIYRRHPVDYASSASFLHELSGGRFVLGVGIGQMVPDFNERFDVAESRPLGDVEAWLDAYLAALPDGSGPPIYLAALRERMFRLAVERFDGAVCANASRRDLARLVTEIPAERRPSFVVGVHVFACVGDDPAATLEALQLRLAAFLTLPNYQAYWREVGFDEETAAAIEILGNGGGVADIAPRISERMVDDCCVRGTAEQCMATFAEMREAGIDLPVVMPVAPGPHEPTFSPKGPDYEGLLNAFDPKRSA